MLSVQVGRGGHDYEILLVGIAETYQKSHLLNILRVDFDMQILDKANKAIIKATQGVLSVRLVCCALSCAQAFWGQPEMLEDFRKQLEKRGLNASILIEVGNPCEKLCEVASREQPDLMLLGHRKSRLGLGSVTLHCIENAPASIYVVRV